MPDLTPWNLYYYTSSVSRALQGRVAGVNVVELADEEHILDTDKDIQIRGLSSVKGSKNPMYVVDGVVKNQVNDINPEDIENIKVLKNASASALYGSRAQNGVVVITTKKDKKNVAPVGVQYTKETSREYSISSKQTVLADNHPNTVIYKTANLDASFTYQTVPKLMNKVYLVGKIGNWTTADFLEGPARIYMENTFVGSTRINPHHFTDTLEVSFGIDDQIIVRRERQKDYSETKFIGSNKRQTISWTISLHNTKPFVVQVNVLDQVPVSTTTEMQVDAIELSGGQLDIPTGKITWQVSLGPEETKDLIFTYRVKYPKNRQVVLE